MLESILFCGRPFSYAINHYDRYEREQILAWKENSSVQKAEQEIELAEKLNTEIQSMVSCYLEFVSADDSDHWIRNRLESWIQEVLEQTLM